MQVKFCKKDPRAKIPTFGHPGDAGLDLYLLEPVTIDPDEYAWLDTGIAWEPSLPAVMLIRPRSSMCKLGIDVTEGTIDSGYRGSIVVQCWNHSDRPVTFDTHHRIAQGVVLELPGVEVIEACELSESSRGTNGFGSTGR
jgi:dUTP pyrophosphatase